MDTLKRKPIVVKLADGPCAGTYATVLSFTQDCWQRLSPRDQVWLRYVKNLFVRGEYVWTGEALTEGQLKAKVQSDRIRDPQMTYVGTQGA